MCRDTKDGQPIKRRNWFGDFKQVFGDYDFIYNGDYDYDQEFEIKRVE